MTVSGEPCVFPFTYKNIEYTSCIVNGPNNNDVLPQCLTTSNTWSTCNGELFKIKYWNCE